MRKIKLLTLCFLGALTLASCGQNEVPPVEEPPIETPLWKLSEESFNDLKSSLLKFEAKSVNMVNQDDGTKKTYNFTSKVIFNENAYSFTDFNENGEEYKQQTYFKDEEGNVILKSLTVNNDVKIDYLVYSSNNQKVKFDEYCNNPLATISYSDFIFDETENYFTIENKDLAYSFSRRLTFYGEKLNSLVFKNTEEGLSVYFSGRANKYSVTLQGLLTKTDEKIKDVTKLEHLPYHDTIDNAMKELDAAKSFTYERVRTDVNDTSKVQTLTTKVTEDAVLYPPDDFTAAKNPYGMAKFNDGTIHSYEVKEDGTLDVNANTLDEIFKPSFDTIAPEFFVEVSENRYELKHKLYSQLTAGNMAETLDEASFVTQIGLTSNLFITIKDGHLETFAYVLVRYYSNGVALEENVVTVKDINTTTIDYKFELK